MGRYWLALTWEVTYSVERWKQEGQIDDGLHVKKTETLDSVQHPIHHSRISSSHIAE